MCPDFPCGKCLGFIAPRCCRGNFFWIQGEGSDIAAGFIAPRFTPDCSTQVRVGTRAGAGGASRQPGKLSSNLRVGLRTHSTAWTPKRPVRFWLPGIWVRASGWAASFTETF